MRMKKTIIIGLLLIFLASGVLANNDSSKVGWMYYSDFSVGHAEWTEKNGAYNYIAATNCINATAPGILYLNNVIQKKPGSTYSFAADWVNRHDTNDGNNDLYIGVDAGVPTSVGSDWAGVSISIVAGGDARVRNNDDAPIAATVGFTNGTRTTLCTQIEDDSIKLYVNATLKITNTPGGAPWNVEDKVNDFLYLIAIGEAVCNIRAWEGACDSEPAPPVPPSPTVTVVYPTNHSNMSVLNPWNGSVVLSTDITANCSINYTTDNIISNLTSHTFDFSATPDGNYSVAFACNHSTNWDNGTFWFWKDEVDPVSFLTSPIPNFTYAENFNVDVTFNDTNLFGVNVTITNATDGAIYYAYSSGPITNGTTGMHIEDVFDVTPLPDYSVLTIFLEAVDSHTKREFLEDVKTTPDKSDPKYNMLEYELDYSDITIEYPKDLEINTIKDVDRFRFQYISDTRGEISFNIQSKQMLYLPNSEYIGHFVIYGKEGRPRYWFDLEGLSVTNIEQVRDNKFRITYNQTKQIEETRSLGGVNYVNWSSNFTVNKNANQVTITGGALILHGFANFTGFLNMSYQYAWFLNGINVSSGFAVGNTPYYYYSSDNKFVGAWLNEDHIDDGNYHSYSNTLGPDEDFYLNTTALPVLFPDQATMSQYILLSLIEANHTISATSCNRFKLVVKNSEQTLYCIGGGTLFQRTWGAGGGNRVYEFRIRRNYNIVMTPPGTNLLITNLTGGGGGNFTLSVRGFNGTAYTSWVNSTPFSAGAIEVNFYDEPSLNPFNYATITADLVSLNANWSEEVTTTNGSLLFTSYGSDNSTIYELRYQAPDHLVRSLFIDVTGFLNSSWSAYLLNDTISAKLDVIVRDFSLIGIPNATITVQRFYANITEWITVAQGRTNPLGLTRFYLEKDDIYYRFIISYNNMTIYTTSGEIINSDTTTYRITTDISSVYTAWAGINGDLDYSNATGTPTFSFAYENKDPNIVDVNLELYQQTTPGGTMVLVATNTTTLSIGTITLELPDPLLYHIALVRLDYSDGNSNYIDVFKDYNPPPPATKQDFRPLILVIYFMLFPALILGGLYITKRLISVPIMVVICAAISYFNPLWSMISPWTFLIIVFGAFPIGYYLNKVNV